MLNLSEDSIIFILGNFFKNYHSNILPDGYEKPGCEVDEAADLHKPDHRFHDEGSTS